MEFRDFLLVLRRNWRLIVASMLVGAVLGGALALLQPRQYATTARAFVSVQSAQTASDLTNGATYAQQAAGGYAAVVESAYVLQPVIDRLDLPTTPAGLSRRVQVSVDTASPVISITVTDQFATRAAKTANAIAEQLTTAADALAPEASVKASSVVKLTRIDPAVVNRARVGLTAPTAVAAGLLAGLVLAVLIGLARELLDTRVRTRQDLLRVTEAPLLGTTLRDRRAGRTPLVVGTEGAGSRAEAYRTIRTNLRFVALDEARSSLVVTSSIDGEGKSTTAANLAVAMADLGRRVLLVDADLRRPRLAHYFEVEGAVGLTDVLIGTARLEEAVQTVGQSGLHLLPAGTIPPNPNEQLQSKAMLELVDTLHEQYDLVLFDTPPLLAVSDALVLAERAGGVIVICSAGRARRPQLAAALESLGQVGARVVGLVLTMVPQSGPDAQTYGYGYDQTDDRVEQARTAEVERPEPATPRSFRAVASRSGRLAVERSAAGVAALHSARTRLRRTPVEQASPTRPEAEATIAGPPQVAAAAARTTTDIGSADSDDRAGLLDPGTVGPPPARPFEVDRYHARAARSAAMSVRVPPPPALAERLRHEQRGEW